MWPANLWLRKAGIRLPSFFNRSRRENSLQIFQSTQQLSDYRAPGEIDNHWSDWQLLYCNQRECYANPCTTYGAKSWSRHGELPNLPMSLADLPVATVFFRRGFVKEILKS